ncbi:MAG: exodeoxyribonuclease VII small subunit [Alphaproteobacteria bacterium]|nr:exodeoxyribonuclease VII small subunit [Alphaproteobacteria bacterium]MDX5369379.1 exodeoxyribonuclease VII small subunit [Alphaproteobacteria bacterium]MDX5464060.1 exodeoxyribonuclease VII small subunit [Alphaproteobacteria bacterium]
MAEDSKTLPDDVRAMSFEEALGELEKIVQRLESGRVALEDSIELYTRGSHLRAHCEAKLKDAEARIEKILVAADGSLSAQPLDGDGEK